MTPTSLPIVQSRRKRLGLAILVLCSAVATGHLWSVKRSRLAADSAGAVANLSQDSAMEATVFRDPNNVAPSILARPPATRPTAVPVPGHFEGITVINQPEPPPPPVKPGTPRNPGKIYPNPPEIGGFVVETDETWAVDTKAPPLR